MLGLFRRCTWLIAPGRDDIDRAVKKDPGRKN
jgi:hypothetical protein